MGSMLLSVFTGVSVYFIMMMLIPKQWIEGDHTDHTRLTLNRLSNTSTSNHRGDITTRGDDKEYGAVGRAFFMLPGMHKIYPLLIQADMKRRVDSFVFVVVVLFIVLTVVLRGQGVFSVPIALILTYILTWQYLRVRIQKRNQKFVDNFPDAIDTVVRSVRSGYPINTALQMVAENAQQPVSTEFRQVIDEVAYGRTMVEALRRMAKRVSAPDVHFFVVVLSVQQESGGNLAEVLNNLSGVLRKRAHLRLKIRAMSSEGRATGWVLGSLPFFVAAVLTVMAPQHLEPLFTTKMGHIFLAASLGSITMGMWIVKQMIKVDI